MTMVNKYNNYMLQNFWSHYSHSEKVSLFNEIGRTLLTKENVNCFKQITNR